MTCFLCWPWGTIPHRDRGKLPGPTVWRLNRCLQGSGACASVGEVSFQDSSPTSPRSWLGVIAVPSSRQSVLCLVFHICVIRPPESPYPTFLLVYHVPLAPPLARVSVGRQAWHPVHCWGTCTCAWHRVAAGRSCPGALSRGKPLWGARESTLIFPCLPPLLGMFSL